MRLTQATEELWATRRAGDDPDWEEYLDRRRVAGWDVDEWYTVLARVY